MARDLSRELYESAERGVLEGFKEPGHVGVDLRELPPLEITVEEPWSKRCGAYAEHGFNKGLGCPQDEGHVGDHGEVQ